MAANERLVCETPTRLIGGIWPGMAGGQKRKLTLRGAGLESSIDRSPHLLFQRANRVDIQKTRQFPPRLLGMFAPKFA